MMRRLSSAVLLRGCGLALLFVLPNLGCASSQDSGGTRQTRTAQDAQEARANQQPGSTASTGEAREAQDPETQDRRATLYDRLGGVYPIAVVVDDFIDRLLVNDILNANPAIDKARKRVPPPGLKYRVTELVCEATGGPCTYTGRTMKAAHAHLSISEREWQAMLADLRKSLAKFDVPEREQRELLAIVASTKEDIVTRN